MDEQRQSFTDLVADLGGRVLGSYERPHRAVSVECAEGHLVEVFPNNLLRGRPLCRFCGVPKWDVFYVVTGEAGAKFGISSGDGARRLHAHARDGYRSVLRLHTGLTAGLAFQLESQVKATLKAAGYRPVRGREYFEADALAVVLPLVDAWLK